MNTAQLLFYFGTFLIVATGGALAQECDLEFDLSWNSIDNGGGVSIAGDLELIGTVGQTEIGEMTSGSLSLTGGFRFVTLPREGDVDGDRFVDLLDYEGFADCLTGPDAGPVPTECRFTDFDATTTVDLADVAIFQAEFGTQPPLTQVRWINEFGGAWENGANWDSGFVPTEQNEAVIDLDGTYTISISSDPSVGSVTMCNANARLRIASPDNGTASLTVENGFTNQGIIDLSTDASGSAGSTLRVVNGTLFNAPGATLLSTNPVGSTARTIDAEIDNQGTIEIQGGLNFPHKLVILNERRTLSSTLGTFSVDPDKTISIVGGHVELGSGSKFLGPGVIDFAGPPMMVTLASDVTNQPGGNGAELAFSSTVTFQGPGTLINEGSLTFNNDTINVDLINHGSILTQNNVVFNLGSNPLVNHTTGTIRIASPDNGASTLTVENGFTNQGIIDLSTDASGSAGSTLRVVNGTLFNAPGARIVSTNPVGSTARTIDAEIDNQGTIEIQGGLNFLHKLVILNERRTLSSTLGTFSVDPDKTISIVGGHVELGSGSKFLGPGVIDFAGPPMMVTLPSDVTHQPGGNGAQLTFSSNVTIQGTGTLINEGSLTFNNETVNVDLINHGSILTQDNVVFNLGNNPLANLATGTIRIASPDNGAASLTVENGFTNQGIIDLSTDASGSDGSTLQVLNGALINAPGATLRSTNPVGQTARTIDAEIDNQGTIEILGHPGFLQELVILNEGRTLSSTSGTFSVDPGKTISIVGGHVLLGSGSNFLGSGEIDFAGPPVTLTLASDVTHQPGGNGAQLTFSSNVTIQGTGTLINEGSLTFNNETVNVDLINHGSILTQDNVVFNLGNNPLANLATGTIRIASPNNGAASLTVENGFTNQGIIDLSTDASGSDGSTLQVLNGALTNAPGATLRSTNPVGQTARTIDAEIDNQGTIDVQQALTINSGAANHLNRGLINADQNVTILQTTDGTFTNTIAGTIDIETAMTVTVSGGSCINNGAVTGAGTFVCP